MLILVLICLALLSILVLSFLVGSTTEVNSSSSQLAAAEAQNLGSSALNLAMRQVQSGANSNSNDRSWASQPGMIRQFVSGSRDSDAIYKLYSAEQMVVTGAGAQAFLPGTDLDPDWPDKPALFADLNAPRSRNGALRFPIVDPRLAPGDVDGFSYSADPGNGSPLAGVNVATDDSARLPMPVRWLYVLQDGTIEAGTSSDGQTVTVPGSTPDNPIIGRVAFWTDDESCKVNINTASEGVYWDTPMGNLESEIFFDKSAPLRGEFQRFAGHPSTVSLSSVFPNLIGAAADPARFPTESSAHSTRNNAYYRITPRIQQGGSYEGLLEVITPADGSASEIPPDTDRLYDTVDELIFQADRTIAAELDSSEIEKRRFFLTAQSRAPELTLFNTPRISIWPLSPNDNEREVIEHLMAFSSSLPRGNGLAPIYFERANAMSHTGDFLRPRNQELFAYMKWSTDRVAPGFVGTLASSWGADRDQILTQVFDYIRSGPNLQNRNNPAGKGYTTQHGMIGGNPSQGYRGVVLPAFNEADDARGHGRFPCISEIAMVFGSAKDDATEFTDNQGNTVTTTVPCSQIWPAIVVQLFTVSSGYKPFDPNVQVRVSGLDSLTWTYKDQNGVEQTTSLYPPGTVKTFRSQTAFGHGGGTGRSPLGRLGVSLLYIDPSRVDAYVPSGPVPPGGNDPSGLSIITSDPASIRFNGSSAPLTFEIYASRETPIPGLSPFPSEAVQTYNISFPAIPVLPRPWRAPDTGNSPVVMRNTMPERVKWSTGHTNFITKEDVIKSLVVRHGDYRLISGKTELSGGTSPTDDFVPHQNYFDGTSLPNSGWVYYTNSYPRAHTLAIDWWLLFPESVNWTLGPANPDLGHLHPGPYERSSTMPHLPPGYRLSPAGPAMLIPPSNNSVGDWDTGTGSTADGAFINKPDEGPDFFSWGADYRNSWLGMPGDPGETQSKSFTPSRQMASPVMFGSLPTGVKRNLPWQTLLFNPNPAAGTQTADHPGSGTATKPPDSLLLDLFWMPVSEPYAISDRLSTAGKINMNFQLAPFTHIRRATALHAAMKNLQLPAISDSLSATYKRLQDFPVPISTGSMRHRLDVTQTLRQFEARFSDGKIFRSPTEITSLFLIPQGQSWIGSNFSEASLRSNAANWWSTHRLTGDNLRERPYNALYPLLTTQSNVYTVYTKAQVIRQLPASRAAGTFTEGLDPVLGSTESSFTIERYLNPETLEVTNETDPLGSEYRLRIINRRDL